LLLGSSRNSKTDKVGSLVGRNLQEFAKGQTEEARTASFISEAAKSSMARRIHLALQRRGVSEAGAREEHKDVLEVTANGIAVPADPDSLTAAPNSAAAVAGALVFVGFIVAPGSDMPTEELGDVSPLENPTLDEVKNAVSSPPPSEVGVPAMIAAPPALALEASSAASGDFAAYGEDVTSPAQVGGRQRAASLCSAPPILESAGLPLPALAPPALCNGSGGDCLPAASAVRVEGRGAPLTADAVELGQRVLCYDHLSGGLKYVEVIDASIRHENTEPDIVEVTLEDGSQVQMTSDHPVFAQDATVAAIRGGLPKAERPVRAADLDPQKHRLVVLKVVPLAVQSVRRPSPPPEGLPKVVSLSVRQPQRHSLLVAPSVGDMEKQSVAVASASMAAAAEMLPHEVRLKNTFIELLEEVADASDSEESAGNADATERPPLRRRVRRSRSEPAVHLKLPPSNGSSGTELTRSSLSTLLSSYGGSSAASYISSKASVSVGDGDSIVVVGKGIEDRRIRGWTCSATMRLSSVMGAKQSGLKSLGSMGHDEGWCYPCLMECWHNSDRPCKFGIACSRCHEPHSRRQFKKARFTKPRPSFNFPLATVAREE